VTLTAAASAGSAFTGWSGCDNSNADQCTVTITADRNVTAMFTLIAPDTKITKSKLDRKRHKAKFSFEAIGSATGFQCALVKKPKKHHRQRKPRFRSCRSPKTYKHLRSGKYIFEVRALNAGGADPAPATKRFTIH
jgi:hypothetical protein